MLRLLFPVSRAVCVASILLGFAGCSSDSAVPGSINSTGTLQTGGAANLFSLNVATASTASTVVVTSLSSGSSTTLSVPTGFSIETVAFDSTNGIEYLGGETSSSVYEVLAYPANPSSLASPTRTIVSNGSFSSPYAMAVGSNGLLYVLSALGVSVYAATADGTPTPLQVITGSSTGLTSPLMLAVDSAAQIYVSNMDSTSTGSVKVFAAGATGNIAPVRSITSASGLIYGIAVDSNQQLYAVEERLSNSTASNVQIAVFASSATGAATPSRTISGSLTGLSYIGGLAIDKVNNLYAINANSSTSYSLLGFGPSASGNVTPGFTAAPSALTNPGANIAAY